MPRVVSNTGEIAPQSAGMRVQTLTQDSYTWLGRSEPVRIPRCPPRAAPVASTKPSLTATADCGQFRRYWTQHGHLPARQFTRRSQALCDRRQCTSVATTAHDPSNAMGSVLPRRLAARSDPRCNDTGAASYSIPIAYLGDCRNAALLALTYQSGRGNWPLVSLGISGLSQIERCKKTIIQDGPTTRWPTRRLTAIVWMQEAQADECRGHLRPANSTYQTEIDEFSR